MAIFSGSLFIQGNVDISSWGNAEMLSVQQKTAIDFEEISEHEINESNLSDDHEFDNAIGLFTEDTEVCLICLEFGSLNVSCFLVLIACSRYDDTPENYICDYCSRS
uniref:Uncharacterized protein n=1 Tax=Clastoptera arizonana TaxID=38151 RepID=A0A1B6DUQ6_9HEMI